MNFDNFINTDNDFIVTEDLTETVNNLCGASSDNNIKDDNNHFMELMPTLQRSVNAINVILMYECHAMPCLLSTSQANAITTFMQNGLWCILQLSASLFLDLSTLTMMFS